MKILDWLLACALAWFVVIGLVLLGYLNQDWDDDERD